MAACSSEQELKATEVLLFTRNRYKTHMSHLRVLSLRMVRKECSRRIGGFCRVGKPERSRRKHAETQRDERENFSIDFSDHYVSSFEQELSLIHI